MEKEKKQAAEKLLGSIRNRKIGLIPSATAKNDKIKVGKKQIKIGIEITGNLVRLSALLHSDQYRLLSYQQVTLPPTMEKQSLGEALTPVLRKFCNPFSKRKLWFMMPSRNVDAFTYEIPQVEAKKINSVALQAAQKEKKFNINAQVFDYHIIDTNASKYRILAYTIPKQEILEWKDFFHKIGYPLEGITINTFCLQNMFQSGWLNVPKEDSVAHIFIDDDWSHIDVFQQHFLVFTREVRTSLNSLLDEIQNSFQKKDDNTPQIEISGQPSLDKANITDKKQITLKEAKSILQAQLIEEENLAPGQPGANLTSDDVFKIIEPALNRLSRQIQRTIAHYNNTMAQHTINKLFISGTMSLYPPLLSYLQGELGIPVEAADPFRFISQYSKIRPPAAARQKMQLLPVISLGLSQNPQTPNFLYTFREKNEEKKLAQIKKWVIAAGFSAAILLAAGNIVTFTFLATEKAKLKTHENEFATLVTNAETLEQQLNAIDPNTDLSHIQELAEKINFLNKYLEYTAKRYEPVSVFSELFALTQEGISINKILYSSSDKQFTLTYKDTEKTVDKIKKEEYFSSSFGYYELQNSNSEQTTEKQDCAKFILLDGVVTTKEQDKNLYLSVYKMILNNSPYFSILGIEKNYQITPGIGNTLYFTIALKVTI